MVSAIERFHCMTVDATSHKQLVDQLRRAIRIGTNKYLKCFLWFFNHNLTSHNLSSAEFCRSWNLGNSFIDLFLMMRKIVENISTIEEFFLTFFSKIPLSVVNFIDTYHVIVVVSFHQWIYRLDSEVWGWSFSCMSHCWFSWHF